MTPSVGTVRIGWTQRAVSGRREMLTWIRRHARSDRVNAERRAVELVYEVFGPEVEDVTPLREEPRTAA